MGTRHSIIAVVDGQTKIAQYGQWDGYPGGQGLTVLGTLQSCDLNDLKEKTSKLEEITPEEYEQRWKDAGHKGGNFVDMETAEKFAGLYPHLSRDCGGEILAHVLTGKADKVQMVKGFPGDSLFCEWCYVVDFDKRTFEVFKGFNQQPLEEGERFYELQEAENEYSPVKLLAEFPLDQLPSEEEFLKACKKDDGDDE